MPGHLGDGSHRGWRRNGRLWFLLGLRETKRNQVGELEGSHDGEEEESEQGGERTKSKRKINHFGQVERSQGSRREKSEGGRV